MKNPIQALNARRKRNAGSAYRPLTDLLLVAAVVVPALGIVTLTTQEIMTATGPILVEGMDAVGRGASTVGDVTRELYRAITDPKACWDALRTGTSSLGGGL